MRNLRAARRACSPDTGGWRCGAVTPMVATEWGRHCIATAACLNGRASPCVRRICAVLSARGGPLPPRGIASAAPRRHNDATHRGPTTLDRAGATWTSGNCTRNGNCYWRECAVLVGACCGAARRGRAAAYVGRTRGRAPHFSRRAFSPLLTFSSTWPRRGARRSRDLPPAPRKPSEWVPAPLGLLPRRHHRHELQCASGGALP